MRFNVRLYWTAELWLLTPDGCKKAKTWLVLFCRVLQHLHKQPRDIKSRLIENLLKARRAGDIDLSDAVADDIQARQ